MDGMATRTYGPASTGADIGLLLLRIFLGVSLFLRHGLEKLTNFSHMAHHFPDPIHIGSHTSLVFALISDGICSILIVLGLGTRIAALIVAVNLAVAFYFVHHYAFFTDHGELMILYIGGALALLFAGAGRFSVDRKMW
jgi:putative oxidoreductase